MKTKAVRLYGQSDLRLEEFELPEIKDNEILARVVSDSICMSSYKAAIQGANHKRVPNDIDKNPIIVGHEFCGDIVKVGAKWAHKFKEGSKFGIQPAINLKDNPYIAPGYSYQYIGGDATYIISENENMGFYMPEEGTNRWYDSMVIPSNAENVKLAHEFINFISAYEKAYDNSSYVGYTSPNAQVAEDLYGEGGDYEGINAYMPRIDNENDEVFQYNEETRKIIANLWSKVKIAASNAK